MSRRVLCANCSQPIRWDGNGWLHVDTHLTRCAMEFFAITEDPA